MPAKKHKRKNVKHHSHSKKKHTSISLLNRYPRLLLTSGLIFLTLSVILLTVGYVSNARVGLSMISLFFGVGLIIFANSAPKKDKKQTH
jgi:hypothetical protein